MAQLQDVDDANAFVIESCMAEFQDLLLHDYLPHFMAPSTGRGRREVAQLVGVLVLARLGYTHGDRNVPERLPDTIDAFLQQAASVTNAVDKGRSLVDNEFESEVFLGSEEEVEALLRRAKRFAGQGLQPGSEQNSWLLDTCWEAVTENTKTRNARVVRLEERLNEAAIQLVLQFYSTELQKVLSIFGTLQEIESNAETLNAVLMGDCLTILSGLRNYRSEAAGVKAGLQANMTSFYEKTMEAIRRREQQAAVVQENQLGGLLVEEQTVAPPSLHPTSITSLPLPKRTSEGSIDYKHNPQPSQRGRTKPEVSAPVTPPSPAPSFSQMQESEEGPCVASPLLPPSARILVVHLARGSGYKVMAVGPLSRTAAASKYATVQKIPAYIAAVEEDKFVIGAEARNKLGAICLQDPGAGSKLHPLFSGGYMVRYEVLLGLFLAKCKHRLEGELGLRQRPFNACLLIVPTLLNSMERQAIVDAATVGGFEWIRLLNELTAVAYDYYMQFLPQAKLAISSSFGTVLYMGDDGEQELGLYKFKLTRPKIEMLGLSGSFVPRHPSLNPLTSTADEVRAYAKDVATASKKTLNMENVSLIVTGDCDEVPRRAVTGKGCTLQKCVFTRPRHADEAAVQGGAGLARKLVKGESMSHLSCEKLGTPISMRLPRGHADTITGKDVVRLFSRNDDLCSQQTIRFRIDRGERELEFSLLDENTGQEMATYVIQFEYPVKDTATWYKVVCVLGMDENGTVRVKAGLKEHGQPGIKTTPLRVQRRDSFGREQVRVWGEYVKKTIAT